MPPTSVSGYNDLLARSRLLSPDELRKVQNHWQASAGHDAENLEAFSQWLVEQRFITPYQADQLKRGRPDRFFLGEYKLLDRIGQGRMAGVYKAVHRLGFPVAIKVLPPSRLKDPQAMGRFQREARLALKLDHPNLVRTFEAGHDKGLHFIVMEYLEGETLEDVLKERGKLPIAEVVPLFHQALLALVHLNERHMVHRDLKPANMMLIAGNTLKILDVGLSRSFFDEGTPNLEGPLDLTVPGELLGDPDYMAPEQARDAHAADIRSDLYSLGCIVYHALTGQPPFPCVNVVRKIYRHATEPVRPLQSFGIHLPDGLERILGRLLVKDPGLRLASPGQAAAALEPFLKEPAVPVAIPVAMPVVGVRPPLSAPPPIPASVDGVGEDAEFHFTRSHYVLLAVGMVVAVLAAVGGVILSRWTGLTHQ